MKFKEYLMEHCKVMNPFLRFEKTYVKDPSQAPQGVKIQRGKRGGYYYDDTGEKEPEQTKPKQISDKPKIKTDKKEKINEKMFKNLLKEKGLTEEKIEKIEKIHFLHYFNDNPIQAKILYNEMKDTNEFKVYLDVLHSSLKDFFGKNTIKLYRGDNGFIEEEEFSINDIFGSYLFGTGDESEDEYIIIDENNETKPFVSWTSNKKIANKFANENE